MINFDMATNIWTPTAAICPARRQTRPKGSRYRDQLMIFWKTWKIAVHRFISSKADSSGRNPMAMPKIIEKNRIAITLPVDRARKILAGIKLIKKFDIPGR